MIRTVMFFSATLSLHSGPRVRLFTELQSSPEEGRTGGPRPTDADLLDGHQGFVDWRILTGKSSELIVRIGREEVGFGSGRLIAPAEGLNLRRSMDGTALWRLGGLVYVLYGSTTD